MGQREFGTCAVWKNGFGFLSTGRGADVFCHFSAIESDERYRTLAVGQRVSFERTVDAMGRSAALNVRLEEAA